MFGTFQAEEERPHYGITKETSTFNPVKAHWKPIADLWVDLGKVRGFDKVRLLFHSPGWFPKSAGGVQRLPEVDDQSYRKFDFLISTKMGTYLLAQFVLLLAFTAIFLFTYNKLEWIEQFAGAGVIIVSLLGIGGHFESRKWAANLELLRLLVVPVFGLLIGEHVFVLNALLLAVISFIWFMVIRNSKNNIIVT